VIQSRQKVRVMMLEYPTPGGNSFGLSSGSLVSRGEQLSHGPVGSWHVACSRLHLCALAPRSYMCTLPACHVLSKRYTEIVCCNAI
jgi:hypothetical protein